MKCPWATSLHSQHAMLLEERKELGGAQTVPNKRKAGFVGVIIVVVILALQSIEHWTVIDTVLTGLRRNGPFGAFLTDALLSRLVPLAIAVAALYLVIEGRREQKGNSDPPSLPPSDKSTTQTQSTGAVTQQVFLSGPTQSAPESKEPEPKPNIRCLGPATGQLRMGMDGHGFYEDEEGRFSESVPGAWVCFRNESSVEKKVPAVFGARASISFLEDSRNEIGTGVSEACWLGDLRRINFNVEESHCVIVVLILKDGTLSCPYMRHVHTNWGEGLLTESYKLHVLPRTIEVRLIRGNDLIMAPFVFDFTVVDGQPVLRQRPLSSQQSPPRW